MSDAASDPNRRNWGSLLVALSIGLLGIGIIGTAVYVDATTSVTRADFAEYRNGCEDLAGQKRMVDAGLGMRWMTLNETHVQQCQNTTYEQYREGKRQSMSSAPLNPGQWTLFLGVGGVLTAVGVVVGRQELARFR